MALYKCGICSYEFDEDRQKKKIISLKMCPSCGARKENLKKARDLYEGVIKQLIKYREGAPKGDAEIED